jgi:hypothetical protein
LVVDNVHENLWSVLRQRFDAFNLLSGSRLLLVHNACSVPRKEKLLQGEKQTSCWKMLQDVWWTATQYPRLPLWNESREPVSASCMRSKTRWSSSRGTRNAATKRVLDEDERNQERDQTIQIEREGCAKDHVDHVREL